LPKAAPFQPGTIVPLRGVPHRLVHRASERGTVWTETRDSGERILCVAGGYEHMDRRVHDFLKREARKDLHKASLAYAAELGVRVRRVSIRDQSSRWGSCTSAGSLSYSWRLILAPPYVLDYLAAHEVAHLVEMNHSPRFWRVVGRVCDHVERAKRWLDTHGNDLHRFGVED
jgi:predicted metal-dependent hydrolase